jgi:hypothetical protein
MPMMFIVRTTGQPPPDVQVKMQRRTPASTAADPGTKDFFCVGDAETLRAQGLTVVSVHDGWYPDDVGGGVAIFGQGRFWEVRDTPFTVKESDGVAALSGTATAGELVNVRGAIFGV